MLLGGRQFDTHGVWKLAYDIARTPVDIIEAVVFKIRKDSYKDIKTLSTVDPAQVAIQAKLASSVDTYDLYSLNTSDIWSQAGACAPWSKPSANCSCEQVCPLSFSLFSIISNQLVTGPENSLFRLNHPQDDKKYWDGDNLGHCWGHAVFTQKMERLAIFAPNETAPFPEGSKKWKAFYKKILRKIGRDEAQIIPGFKNILEMSSHPSLARAFLNRVSDEWSDNSMSLEGLFQTSFALPQTKKNNLKYIRNLRERLMNYQKPVVLMGMRFPLFGAMQSHVNLVSRVYEDGGNTIVCYENNNNSPSDNAKCARKDVYAVDGTLIEEWYGRKTIVHHENKDTAKQLRSLWKLCRKTRCGT